MKVTFVGLGTEQLGLSQLSAICKQNAVDTSLAFNASLFNDRFNLEIPFFSTIFDETDSVLQKIESDKPDILAISPMTSTYQWALQVAKASKQINPNIKVLFGGVHTSALPLRVLENDFIDFAVVGEGDIAIMEIIKAVEENEYNNPIINTYHKNNSGIIIKGRQSGFLQDLDSLPFLDKPLWEEHVNMNEIYMTLATRGCPYRCTFCFNSFYADLPEEKSKFVRMRSVDHVIAELKVAKRRYNMRWVDFEDDVFATKLSWLEEFAYKYKKEINIPYQILTHPRYVNEKVAKLLKESGCQWIQMGIQSTDDDFKKKSLMRYEKIADVENAMKYLNMYGLKVKVDHMFGLPNEPEDAQKNAQKLYSNTSPARIQTFWTSFLPGTAMMKEAIEDGTLSQQQADNINDGKDFLFFRNIENVRNPELVRKYLSYEFLFKIFPLLNKRQRENFDVQSIRWIPTFFLNLVAFLSDLGIGFKEQNPVFKSYAIHNLYHLKRHLKLFLRLNTGTATTIYEDSSFGEASKKAIELNSLSKLKLEELK